MFDLYIGENAVFPDFRVAGFNGVSELRKAADLSLPVNKSRQRKEWPAKEILVESLRDFWVLNGRLPISTDYLRGLPARAAFIHYFGTMFNAFCAAGFMKHVERRHVMK